MRFRKIPEHIGLLLLAAVQAFAAATGGEARSAFPDIGVERGIAVLVGLPDGGPTQVLELARAGELTLYVQSDNAVQLEALRTAADAASLLGRRIFADTGPLTAIHLADDVADGLWVASSAEGQTPDAELLRVLRPNAAAFVGTRKLTKPPPEGTDEWTHPYHGPDNNTQSNDRLARGALRTQFLAFPMFSPMPEQTVIAGGRIYKAMGHIAHRANQNEMVNTLLCINAYNGTILWKRPSPPGFMIHRNTMIATPDALYLGDHESCKVIDGRTGKVRDEIAIDPQLTDGPVWKWMAIQGPTLYALVGNQEIRVDAKPSDAPGLGHWPWGMWQGHEYSDPRSAFGFGRTLAAIDLNSKKVRWHYRDDEYLDARGVCMNRKQVFCYAPGKSLASLDAADGRLLWKNSGKELLDAIGPNGRAQLWTTGYATSSYMKCNEEYVFFAGPQRKLLVVASAADGRLVWTYPTGNLQLVLRDDAIWAAGPEGTKSGFKLDYRTGKVLAEFPARRACTRATGCADSIFFRANEGTVRVLTETNTAQHLAPMRPPCQDGVLVAHGHFYWGPWMCGCPLSLYGHICLSPAGNAPAPDREALATAENAKDVAPLNARPGDWPCYRGNPAREDRATVALPAGVKLQWTAEVCRGELPTAPVAAGGLVFVADRTGAVRAFDGDGRPVWTSYTAGPVYYPPALAMDRLFVGSADGRVYALEARTGRPLWTYRVAPRERWIPAYGRLISTWPVAGGVVVEEATGTVYAAAGIAHYDGTYVVALDAVTGALKARNETSGTLAEQVNGGISLQGNLEIVAGELRFLGGGVYETARYDLRTLKCLNEPKVQVTAQFHTAFYPYYPAYGKYVSLDLTLPDGRTLTHDASYEGNLFGDLALRVPLPPGTQALPKPASRWYRPPSGKLPKAVWQDQARRRFTSFIVAGDRLLAAGHSADRPNEAYLTVLDIGNGSDVWSQKLPALAVKSGAAIDGSGRIYVSLENGQLLCFVPVGAAK